MCVKGILMTFSKNDSELFDVKGRFIVHNYDQAPPFSSFLPGISGLFGIPMWVFYTNRGQAISSFGIESKDHPIMEFQPANKAYQLTNSLGFRTFLKSEDLFYEPFTSPPRPAVQRNMFIGMNELEIREIDLENNLEIRVLYFNLSNEPVAGLVRQLTIRNTGYQGRKINILDGLPAIYPYGVNNAQLKFIGRTIEAWMEVLHLESNLPYYRLRASAEDTSEIRSFQAGNYALAAISDGFLPAIVDPRLIFGSDTSFQQPQGLLERDFVNILTEEQTQEGRTPCAFFGTFLDLAPDKSVDITSLYGYAESYAQSERLKSKILQPDYIVNKYSQARELTCQLTKPLATKSGNPLFDAYCRQTFLDNLLRGGWPHQLGGQHIYHIFSRKHGDPERDYNHFFLAPEYYSQGNGSYRDVNQNRRSDILFNPKVAEFNVRLFLSLIQLDGYNPLVVEGTKFTLAEEHREEVLNLVSHPEGLVPELSDLFTPGSLLAVAQKSHLTVTPQEFIDHVFGRTEQHIQADFSEGYWVDHWTYNLDLIESYLDLYPDKKTELLFESTLLPFYDSPAVVNPRSEKYILDKDRPRQIQAISKPVDKLELLGNRKIHPNWVRTEQGRGDIFRLPLISKLLLLAIIKFSSLDPLGMGLEMEAGRPGWDDALNGLPGMFGSSIADSFELARLFDLLITNMKNLNHPVVLPIEANQLLTKIQEILLGKHSTFNRWDELSTARETYREKTKLGVDGTIIEISSAELLSALVRMQKALNSGLDRAQEFGHGITPTYFTFEVAEYKILKDTDLEGRHFIKPTKFNANPLPLFLEGPAHQLKILPTREESQSLYQQVRNSELYDQKLKTYKLNASLSKESFSIGRARAFSPGWLENESIWLHMTLKYLLEVLRSGLYEQFFEDLQHTLPPFLDPDRYGRSPLENSSFIVSSAHPDPSLHGRGFVARMSGATAEFLSIWFTIMTGGTPFSLDKNDNLQLSLHAKLPSYFFSEDGTLEYTLLGNIQVRIHNPNKLDTWKTAPTRYELVTPETKLSITGSSIPEPQASLIRDGNYSQIDIYY
jgi:hypothetical protein